MTWLMQQCCCHRTRDLQLIYRRNKDRGGLIGFADSDGSPYPDMCFSYMGIPFHENQRSEQENASSTLEAELYAISYASKHLLWIQEGLSELQENSQPEPAVLYGDNQGTLQLIQNEKINDITKHVAVTYHYMQNLVLERRCFGLEYVASNDNLADICTKSLARPQSCGT